MNPDMPECRLHCLFTLDLSAASGLVLLRECVHVIADDHLGIHRFGMDGKALPPIILSGGEEETGPLPKPRKPDLEALMELADGRLLALGSGSTPRRERGFRIDPIQGSSETIDLAPLYARLRSAIGTLNIEGACGLGSRIVLAHRGVGEHGRDTLLLLRERRGENFADLILERMLPVELGRLDGVPLTITDLAMHPRRGLHFCAAAEATEDAYLDGRCTGSVMGRFDHELRPCDLQRLRPDVKIEGLSWWKTEGGFDHWLMVADADDPSRRSPLFTATTPV